MRSEAGGLTTGQESWNGQVNGANDDRELVGNAFLLLFWRFLPLPLFASPDLLA